MDKGNEQFKGVRGGRIRKRFMWEIGLLRDKLLDDEKDTYQPQLDQY